MGLTMWLEIGKILAEVEGVGGEAREGYGGVKVGWENRKAGMGAQGGGIWGLRGEILGFWVGGEGGGRLSVS